MSSAKSNTTSTALPTASGTYARRAMDVCQRPFHDAHPAYSDAVLKELDALAKKLDDKGKKCIAPRSGCKDSQKPFPAPDRILTALNKLANTIKAKKLRGKRRYKTPWVTSSRADGYKPK
jgi:hypothetical protein